ncbi:hypothetical protein D9613_000480 [Agrocybe pediades]|uniref:RlpA-like double-psi beta-barrel-protein domain-containing protein-containing protein n=1 Tax=Agrocybe pediades TaxID=84607 RepID=A0A8H4R0W8_9AGAR|nr:hypothetical protein D9613_000480 [Agrocybe pediades]
MLHINIVVASISLFSLFILGGASTIGHGSPLHHRHHEVAKRVEGDIEVFRRASGVRMTFYDVETGNAGSCGHFLKNSDPVVAMNSAQMNPGWCFKSIRISFRGISRIATIQDTCPTCPWGGLDLSKGLFQAFLPEASGVFAGDWEFVDGSGGNNNPTPTSTKKPRTTSIWHPPTPTPTSTRRTSSKTSSVVRTSSSRSSQSSSSTSSATKTTDSASTSLSSVNYLSGAASGLAVPTGIIDTQAQGGNTLLQDLNDVIVQMGALAMAGAHL